MRVAPFSGAATSPLIVTTLRSRGDMPADLCGYGDGPSTAITRKLPYFSPTARA
jgi:hypothetical protein